MPFEDVYMEATHACVFVIILVGLRGSRRFLAKLYLMIFPDDIGSLPMFQPGQSSCGEVETSHYHTLAST